MVIIQLIALVCVDALYLLEALIQSIDVLLHRSPHADLVDDVRRLLGGEAGGRRELVTLQVRE